MVSWAPQAKYSSVNSCSNSGSGDTGAVSLCGREVGNWFSCRCTHTHTEPCRDLVPWQTGWRQRFYCRSTTKPLWGFSSVAWQTESGDLTHRGTPGRRCQADRSERRREKTPLILQMKILRATLVTLLVMLQSWAATRMDWEKELDTNPNFTYIHIFCEYTRHCYMYFSLGEEVYMW